MNVSVSKNILNVTIGETNLKLLTSAVVNVDGDADTLQGEDSAYYLDRSNHTGTQAIGTIDGLQAALDNKIEGVAWGDITGTLSDQTDLQDALDLKLDAADYNDRFLGLYASLFDLQSAHPTASAGDYAQVDLGIGTDVITYAWDVNDAKWAAVGSSAIANTDALPEGSSNLYHTGQRVRDTALSGLSLLSSLAITAADSVLSAFGKLQAQISALATVARTGSYNDLTNKPNVDTSKTTLYQTPTSLKPISNSTINAVETMSERMFDENYVIPANTLQVGDIYEIEAIIFAARSAVTGTQAVVVAPYLNSAGIGGFTSATSSTLSANSVVVITVNARLCVHAIGASGRIGVSGFLQSGGTSPAPLSSTLQTYNTTQPITVNCAFRLQSSALAGDVIAVKLAKFAKINNPS